VGATSYIPTRLRSEIASVQAGLATGLTTLALDRETTVREFYRLAKRQGRDPEGFPPRRLYRYDIALAAVLDLRELAIRTALPLSDSELRSNDASRCQQIGESANHLGPEGILAPSATGEGAVLVVFFERLRADSQVRDLDYEPWSAPPPEPRPS
jgi:hypothetical protein